MTKLQGVLSLFFDSDLHLWLQNCTSSQDLSHFFRHAKDLWQCLQIFSFKFNFLCKINLLLSSVNKELNNTQNQYNNGAINTEAMGKGKQFIPASIFCSVGQWNG